MLTDTLGIFATAATAIFMESAPFLLLGSFIGALLEVLVPQETLLRRLPKSASGQIAVGLFAGMLLPTCECGIVPVARRLLLKGVPPRCAIPYMMAAPVVNPIVMASTLFAFQGDVSVVVLRVFLVIVPAVGLALTLGEADAHLVLRHGPVLEQFHELALEDDHADGHTHEHTPGHMHEHEHGCACGCCASVQSSSRVASILFHTAAEFLSMSRFLIFGAVVAAGFKTWLPPETVEWFTGNPFIAVGGLMLLAILLSICSEADAFVAASFASFPLGAKVAFMAVGPMVDLKLIPMFFAVFQKRLALALTLVPVIAVYAMGLVLSLGGD